MNMSICLQRRYSPTLYRVETPASPGDVPDKPNDPPVEGGEDDVRR